ncbi:MAG: hypothetical protein QGI45_03340, partial [Myxococcota bacterium]|nr:hypothetical protein [Myxococcota bacterium]
TEHPELSISLLGINQEGHDSANDVVSENAAVTLPWLQDNADADVWSLWNANWRDIIILDKNNKYYSTFSVHGDHNPLESEADGSNRIALKNMLIAAAQSN